MLRLRKILNVFFLLNIVLLVFVFRTNKAQPINLSQQRIKAIQNAIDKDEDIRELTIFAPEMLDYEYIFSANSNKTSPNNISRFSNTPIPRKIPEHISPTRSVPTPTSDILPNIILIVVDDQRFDAVQRMPFLGSQTEYWHIFTKAYSNVALCCPSRAAILTGLLSHHSGVEDNNGKPFFNETDNLVTHLQNAGYKTAIIGKYLNKWAGSPVNTYTPPGWDNFTVFMDPIGYYNYGLYENGSVNSFGNFPEDYSTDVLGKKALDFVNNTNQPFFLLFTPYAPHSPFFPAPKYETANVGTVTLNPGFYESDFSDKPNWVNELPPRDFQEMRKYLTRQYRMSLSVDDWIKSIYSALEDRKIADKTFIIYMSDNSFSFGEHKIFGKMCGYEYCNHIPLLIRYPNVNSTTINHVVSNVDIAPTIAEIAGISPVGMDGSSLIPYIRGATDVTHRKGILIHWAGNRGYEIPHFWGIVEDEYKYIELETGEKELYNLVSDPYELINLANKREYIDLINELHNDLVELVK
jgi:arylsulfatase A-like enzyme